MRLRARLLARLRATDRADDRAAGDIRPPARALQGLRQTPGRRVGSVQIPPRIRGETRRQASARNSFSSFSWLMGELSPSVRHCRMPLATILNPARSSAFDTAASWVTMSVQSRPEDRKSTRLNSSHRKNSYDDLCLKKKKRE